MEVEVVATVTEPRRIPTTVYNQISKVHNSTVDITELIEQSKGLYKIGQTWPGMLADVTVFLKTCPCCQKMNYLKLSLDCIGPMREYDDKHTHTHILVIIDNVSRYTA